MILRGMSGACLGHHLWHVWENMWGTLSTCNGQRSAVLHASVMPFFGRLEDQGPSTPRFLAFGLQACLTPSFVSWALNLCQATQFSRKSKCSQKFLGQEARAFRLSGLRPMQWSSSESVKALMLSPNSKQQLPSRCYFGGDGWILCCSGREGGFMSWAAQLTP